MGSKILGQSTEFSAKRLSYQQITSLAAATALTVPAGATSAVVGVEGQAVRWRDTTAPTAAIGNYIAAGGSISFEGNLDTLQFIEVTSGAKLNVQYYKD